jgi:ankyrin repeat protein
MGRTPLYEALHSNEYSEEKKAIDCARRLLEHGADTNICDITHSSPLHQASSRGWLEVARLLLSYGAKVDEEDGEGLAPFQVASSKGYHEITKLLLEHGAVPK